MIELGYNFSVNDLNKIKRYKNPTLDIKKAKLNKNSKYKIFLNKTQFNNLIEDASIKYKLSDSKKNKSIMIGDGLVSLFQMALPFVKSVAHKVLGTLGLSSIGALTSSAINKKMNKGHIIKLSDKQLGDINKNLDKINKMKVFDKKLTLNQKGSRIFSFLLPMLASTIIPSLLSKKDLVIFFEKIKNKCSSLFDKSNYPLSNIFINNLLKDKKYFKGCFSKDQIPLIKNNESIIFNTRNLYNNEIGHWISLSRSNNTIFIFDSFGIGFIPSEIYKIFKDFRMITNIYRIQHITSNLCGLFAVLCILFRVNNKNKFIEFLTLFNKNHFLKNELV